VINCYSTGKVSGDSIYVGGVVGSVYGGSVVNSYSTAAVSGRDLVGGVAGYVSGSYLFGGGAEYVGGSINNCAALNPYVKGIGYGYGVGRVVGWAGYVTTTSGNVAFAGMETNGGISFTGGANDGADLTLLEINHEGTIGGLFTNTGGWSTQTGYLPGLFGNVVPMPEHLQLFYPLPPNVSASVVLPTSAVSPYGIFTVGPNPVTKRSSGISIFREGARVKDAALAVYDASGNLVKRIKISDKSATGKRRVGTWNLKDAKGKPVSEGTYLLRGTVTAVDGKTERVSLVVGVR
jgi:hypothetical protein